MNRLTGRLLLLPSLIGDARVEDVLPAAFIEKIEHIRIFFVEEVRTARRFLRKVGFHANFDEVSFIVVNEHTKEKAIEELIDIEQIKGQDIGLLSEAGVPCVADPGSSVVAWAHRNQMEVIPFVGPSSILMALMASGFNGQNFCFCGYLPSEKFEREKKIRDLEAKSRKEKQTQIFIETPYRNQHLFESLCSVCHPSTLLCIAKNISMESQYILSISIGAWKQKNVDLHKQNTVFLLYAET